MKRKWITTLIIIGSLALLGIVLVQFLWIRNALLVNRDKFERSVSLALARVSDQLEKKEEMRYLDHHMDLSITTESEDPQPRPRPGKKHPPKEFRTKDSTIILENFPDFFSINVDSLFNEFQINAEWKSFQYFDGDDWPKDSLIKTAQRIKVCIPFFDRSAIHQNVQGLFIPPQPPDPFIWTEPVLEHEQQELDREVLELKDQQQDASRLKRKVNKMKDVVKQMVVEVETKNKKIEDRIQPYLLTGEMNKAFTDAGIHSPYEYAVLSPEKNSVTALHSLNFSPGHPGKVFATTLFPNDLVTKAHRLVVYFPDQTWKLLKSMSILMIASVVFTLALLLTFLATILTLLRQKKLSEIKTDFINNMTHEFKTPIATISLATDSINNPKVISNPERIQNYTRVIREENQRMNTHVEQVLQMALLDKREIELNMQVTDVHELITRTVENILLQVEKKGGSVTIDLQADQYVVKADEIHLFNAVLNLLDNANKYSPETPDIRVFTQNQAAWLVVGVEDKGLGMSKEVQKKIFERFFRAHTGNIHNVKGFGLGLSYVKAIVDAHKGKISVHSEPGKGSTFEIKLPLV